MYLNLQRAFPKYLINLYKVDNIYHMECNTGIDNNGNKRFLHNEISCEFIINGNDLKVLSGWHIGTEDFEWNEEGYDWVLEEYHPGITEQIKTMLTESSCLQKQIK